MWNLSVFSQSPSTSALSQLFHDPQSPDASALAIRIWGLWADWGLSWQHSGYLPCHFWWSWLNLTDFQWTLSRQASIWPGVPDWYSAVGFGRHGHSLRRGKNQRKPTWNRSLKSWEAVLLRNTQRLVSVAMNHFLQNLSK